jgi:hypothetical protein
MCSILVPLHERGASARVRDYTCLVLSVADLVAEPRFAAPLSGATAVGQAAGQRLVVRIGVWLEGPRVRRARWQASTCAALIAYCEAACAALEQGTPADAAALRAHVAGVHPLHLGRADLVARAVSSAHERARRDRDP